MDGHKNTGVAVKRKGYGALTAQEAAEYVIFTHYIEGMELSDEEKAEFLKDVENGTCDEGAGRVLEKYRNVVK